MTFVVDRLLNTKNQSILLESYFLSVFMWQHLSKTELFYLLILSQKRSLETAQAVQFSFWQEKGGQAMLKAAINVDIALWLVSLGKLTLAYNDFLLFLLNTGSRLCSRFVLPD